MILESSKVILLHVKTHLPLKRHHVEIKKDTTFEDLRGTAKQLYEVNQNILDMFVKLNDREVLLTKENFQYFKATVHINKIIKIREHDINSLTIIQPDDPKQERKLEYTQINKEDLQPINDGVFESDYSSFLANDFYQLVPMLQGIISLSPDLHQNQEDQLSSKLIEHLAQSFRPALEGFYASEQLKRKMNKGK